MTSASLAPAPNAAGWNKTAVTVTLNATDQTSGVASTQYRPAGAANWTTYAAPFQVTAPGVSTYEARSTDAVGNVEATKTFSVRIDATRPVTSALANTAVYRGRRATLRLRVKDTISRKATVTVKIYRRGILNKTLKLGLRYTNREIRYTGYVCWLPRGSYIWKVYAVDLAGNAQKLPVGYRTLTVR